MFVCFAEIIAGQGPFAAHSGLIREKCGLFAKGTRGWLLAIVTKWISDPDGTRVFWSRRDRHIACASVDVN